jgi:RHS repeat-associated protein
VQQDANYNVTAITDALGNVRERYALDPYGGSAVVLTASWGQIPASLYSWVYLHQGGRYDSETGLYDFRNRFYDPEKGRWLNLDPIGFAAGDSNLYRYESGGPANALDPAGLQGFGGGYGGYGGYGAGGGFGGGGGYGGYGGYGAGGGFGGIGGCGAGGGFGGVPLAGSAGMPMLAALGYSGHAEALAIIEKEIRQKNPQAVGFYFDTYLMTIVKSETGNRINSRRAPDIVIMENIRGVGRVATVYELKWERECTQEEAETQLNLYIKALTDAGIKAVAGNGSHGGTSGRKEIPWIQGTVKVLTWQYMKNGIIVYRWDTFDKKDRIPRFIPVIPLLTEKPATVPVQAPQNLRIPTSQPPAIAAQTMPKPIPQPEAPLLRVLPRIPTFLRLPLIPIAPVPSWWLPSEYNRVPVAGA